MTRNYGCRIIEDIVYKQYRAVMIENEKLQIILLLDRGGEPIRWLHKPSDTDLIWKTRTGLLPPQPLYADYQMTYPGGWQEMLPEISYTHEYRGTTVHRGETAISPWKLQIIKDEPSEIIIRLSHQLRSLPLSIEKDINMKAQSTKVVIEETVRNEAAVQMETNWGHHLAYGAPFLNEQSQISFTSGAKIIQPATGESWQWPYGKQAGVTVDLSQLPPRGTKRDLLAVETVDGRYQITNPLKQLALEVSWDNSVWPYVWYWQNFAADQDAPFFAYEYNIGLEMCNVLPKLTLVEAAATEQALIIAPEGKIHSWLTFEVKECGSN